MLRMGDRETKILELSWLIEERQQAHTQFYRDWYVKRIIDYINSLI